MLQKLRQALPAPHGSPVSAYESFMDELVELPEALLSSVKSPGYGPYNFSAAAWPAIERRSLATLSASEFEERYVRLGCRCRPAGSGEDDAVGSTKPGNPHSAYAYMC